MLVVGESIEVETQQALTIALAEGLGEEVAQEAQSVMGVWCCRARDCEPPASERSQLVCL